MTWLDVLVIFEAGRIVRPLKFTCTSWTNITYTDNTPQLPMEMIEIIHLDIIKQSVAELEGSEWYLELVGDKCLEIYYS